MSSGRVLNRAVYQSRPPSIPAPTDESRAKSRVLHDGGCPLFENYCSSRWRIPLNVLSLWMTSKRITKFEVAPMIACPEPIWTSEREFDKSSGASGHHSGCCQEGLMKRDTDNLERSKRRRRGQPRPARRPPKRSSAGQHHFGAGVKDRASDIHIEPFENRAAALSHRRCWRMFTPPLKNMLRASRFKIMSSLDIAERRIAAGRAHARAGRGRKTTMRVFDSPTVHGRKDRARVLDKVEPFPASTSSAWTSTFHPVQTRGGRAPSDCSPRHRPTDWAPRRFTRHSTN